MFHTQAAELTGGDHLETGEGKRLAMLIIDPQNDFHEGGALAVPGSTEDSERIAAFLREHSERIDTVVVTLDSHNITHIASPCFWEKTAEPGVHPLPFTLISCEMLENGVWRARNPAMREWAKEYDA